MLFLARCPGPCAFPHVSLRLLTPLLHRSLVGDRQGRSDDVFTGEGGGSRPVPRSPLGGVGGYLVGAGLVSDDR
ncbi:MAG: hypothetical protein KGQ93_14875 [Cyanobacteria bacterium REEB459]|nr:hypothetical protein [Cyanobacteria bacterium REEB459]